MLNKLPNELRSMIVRLLRNKNDRDALATAVPEWEATLEREEGLRSLTYDPSGLNGLNKKALLEMFGERAIRLRQFLEEVNVDMLLRGRADSECCGAAHNWDGEDEELSRQVRGLLDALSQISKRFADETALVPPPIRLAFLACRNGCDMLGYCPFNRHSNNEALNAKLYGDDFALYLQDNDVPEMKGWRSFIFRIAAVSASST
jgi:hypothetical protein